jgi:hypothetical protein
LSLDTNILTIIYGLWASSPYANFKRTPSFKI